jgi:hypothetical protein
LPTALAVSSIVVPFCWMSSRLHLNLIIYHLDLLFQMSNDLILAVSVFVCPD